ncbi:MAG: DUF2075 domain-containing protein [Chitinophagaceae bacterium]|nr:DUF2075 domain-containing protein [Chitinophagaceae bacterium]
MERYFYSASISDFLNSSQESIIGLLAQNNQFSTEQTQVHAWTKQIDLLKRILNEFDGVVYFEYSIPRMGRRIDVVLIIKGVIFVVEFKVGEREFNASALDQVWDYSLDLKNFHATSQNNLIAPILIATEASSEMFEIKTTAHNDNLLFPIKATSENFKEIIIEVLKYSDDEALNSAVWENGRYSPTPTIIEAATALYNNHSVADISRSDAEATNLTLTSNSLTEIIEKAKNNGEKIICFVTGVPGAGKTLVGLDVATKHMDKEKQTTSVYLSGNGPLVAVLREALTRDRIKREKEKGNKLKKSEVFGAVKSIIQNVHHFRDEYLKDESAPFDHVAIFDEAQRAWNLTQTASFMKQKKGKPDFPYSEPEFLISCLDRHIDWAVIICLVGGGQEINKGEAGISEWVDSLNRSFQKWHVYVSSKLTDSEYAVGNALQKLEGRVGLNVIDSLHLSVSLRSFRAENLSLLVKHLLDLNIEEAKRNYFLIKDKYPIVLTRELSKAKKWLKEKARGSERYGIVVSSQAQRLKPHAIDVKSPMDPIHWFLDGKDDVRSSYYLEDVATEFHVQGLELDWSCITWDGDFRYNGKEWKHFSFSGNTWKNIKSDERKQYLKNAYRVLLTRARQGMIIVVPNGDQEDTTRNSEYYDPTFNYLSKIGFEII